MPGAGSPPESLVRGQILDRQATVGSAEEDVDVGVLKAAPVERDAELSVDVREGRAQDGRKEAVEHDFHRRRVRARPAGDGVVVVPPARDRDVVAFVSLD